ncbi:MAG: ATP synthase subunit I [Actinomycetota bacterium]|nr:ATP synthase subunit I [Actinomycetota bacterium]
MKPAQAERETASDQSLPETPAVEREVAFDMIKRGAPALPLVVVAAGLIWGVDGALSGAFAVGVVLINFVISALLVGWAARVSPAVLMGTVLFGFLARMLLLTAAVVAVRDLAWVNLTALAITLLVTHLGLLMWETRHVSASLAFPSLTPKRKG